MSRRLTNPTSSRLLRFLTVLIVVAMAAALTVVTLVVTPPADAAGSITNLKSVVDGQSTAAAGETITYQIDLACSSLTDHCGSPVFTDILPPGVELVSVDLGGAPAWVGTDDGAGNITVTRDPANPIFNDGDSVQFFITVRVLPDADPNVDIVNNTTVTSDNGTPDAESTAPPVDVLPPEPMWETAKTQISPPAGVNPAPNVPVEYRVEFCGSTIGNLPLEDIDLVDQLPVAPDGTVPVINDTDGGTYDAATNTITWPLEPVTAQDLYDAAAAGEEEVCQTFIVDVTYPGNEATGEGFVIGTDITNTAIATDGPLPGDGTAVCEPNCEDDSPGVIAEGNTSLNGSKWSDSDEISPNGILTYYIGIDTNQANIANPNAMLVDDTPDELRIRSLGIQQSWQYGFEVWITEEGSTTPVLLDDVVQGPPPTPGGPSLPWESWTQSDFDAALGGVDVEVDKVELRFYTGTGANKVYQLQPTRSASLELVTQLRPGFDTVGATFENCAQQVSSTGTEESCREATITPDDAEFYVNKSLSPTSISPGEVQTVTLRLYANSNNAVPIQNPVLFDLLPPGFEYVGDSTVSVGNSSLIAPVPMPTIEAGETSYEVDPDFNGSGRSLVRFSWPGYQIDWTATEANAAEQYWDQYIDVTFDIRPVAGTEVGPYENIGGGTTTSPVGSSCPNSGDGQAPDDLDYDGDPSTSVACFDTENTQVLPAAALSGAKYDATDLGIPNYNNSNGVWGDPACPTNPNDPDFTRFPCVAQTVPGQNVDYVIEIQNSGNVPLDNYWLYDVLPYVGDTGVGEPLYTTARGSAFPVSITGPITLVNLPAGSGTPVIEYSFSTDPCRDEVANPGTPTPWPPGCVNDWTATPGAWADVRAFRINIPFDGDTFDGAETFSIEFPGLVPAGAPWGSIAWNSFAQRADNTNTNTTLLPTEPRQVGVRIPGLNEPEFDPQDYPIPYDQALTKVLDIAGSPDILDGVGAGDQVSFTLRVENQGQVIDSVSVVDYIDLTKFEPFDSTIQTTTATDLNLGGTTTTPGDAWTIAWSGDGTGLATAALTPNTGNLFIGDVIEFPIVLVIADPRDDGAIENWAEISDFNNSADPNPQVDEDSTPDSDQTNDNQPDGPGEPGDDVVTGDGDPAGTDPQLNDEDDHDVAGLPYWDLALVKELGSSQGFSIDLSTSPATATWSITVKNQGPEDAFLIEVTDQLPAGMSFVSLGATTAGDATVTTSAAAGATGAITFGIDELLATGELVTFEFTTQLDDPSLVEYVNVAEIGDFDDDSDPNNPDNPLANDTDSTPDSDPANDEILDDPGTDPNGNDDQNSHNDVDYDQDGDGNLNEPNPDDEDDHDQEVVVLPFDIALAKTLASAPTTPLVPGVSTVDFLIEITGQGRPVQMIEVTDYIDTSLFSPLTVLPAGGAVTDDGDGDDFNYTWNSPGAAPVVTVTGAAASDELDFGETLLIPITLTIAPTWDGTQLVNWAEISDFDDDLDPTVTANSDPNDDLFDADSTPDNDQTNDDQPTGPGQPGDDVIDNTGGDEDDHDVAGVQIWDLELVKELGGSQGFVVDISTTPPRVAWSVTVTNQGTEDATFIAVTDHIPAGMEFDSMGAVTAGTATVSTAAAAGATGSVVFDIDALAAGESVTFEFTTNLTSLATGEFLNIAEISEFDDDDDPNNAPNPFAVDVDSTPDADPTNDAILDDPGTDPNGNDDSNSHNTDNYDEDGDGNVNEVNPSDEDDHDQELVVVPFDLALAKVIAAAPTFPLIAGVSDITFNIEITNQGRPVQTISVVDYIDDALWEDFIAAVNPDSDGGAVMHLADTGDGDLFSYTWDASDPLNPVATLVAVDAVNGELGVGETLRLPITLRIDANWNGDDLVNWAEISNFDDDANPDNGDAEDGTLEDLDSTPDTDQGDDNQPGAPGEPGDNVIDGDGDGPDPIIDDEDDHDVAGVEFWDLALIKELGTGQTYSVDPTSGAITVNWSVTVKNQGNNDAFFIEVTDQIPAGMEFVALGATTAGTATVTTTAVVGSTGAITFDIDALPAGDQVTFEFTMDMVDTTIGEYLNIAEISAFDDDNDPVNPANPAAVDIDSTPDSDPTDDEVLDDAGTDPNGNDDLNSHNEIDFDADGDGNVNERELDENGIAVDEDDHDQELIVTSFDLALEKTFVSGPTTPLTPGTSTVTFEIEITNQGRPVRSLSVVDYIDPALWEGYVAPADGSVLDSGGDSFDFSWDDTDPFAPVISLETQAGDLGFGETIVIPVTLTIAADWAGDDLVNWAEISNFDNDTDPTNGDADPDNPANGGDPFVDLDSTPDTDQSDDNQPTGPDAPGDGVIDGDGDGDDPITDDEDDHDVAGVPIWDLALTKELGGSQPFVLDLTTSPVTAVWSITVKNQGNQDAFLIAVTDHIPAGMEFDSIGATTAGTATVSTAATTGATGLMDFAIDALPAGDSVTFEVNMTITDIDQGQYLNSAEISDFDDDADPDNAENPAAFDVDSTPDSDPANDVILTDPGTDPNGNDDLNSHNDVDYDEDGDGNLNEVNADDEDDHDQELLVAVFDLALEKTLAVYPTTPIAPGVTTVGFEIEVTNQGRPVRTLDVVDYINDDLWAPFAAVDNPDSDGVVVLELADTGDGDLFSFAWDGSSPLSPVVSLVAVDPVNGELAFGETIVIPVTLTIAADWAGDDLVNWAEISNFDNDTDPTNGDADPDNPANGGDPFVDLDSTPDTDPKDDNQPKGPDAPGDGVIDGDGVGGDPITDDEDDHDVAGVPMWDLALTKELGVAQTFVVDASTTPPTVRWSITVKNQGNQDAYLVSVTDYVPAGMEFAVLGATTSGAATVTTTAVAGATGTVDFAIDALPAGDSVTFEFDTNIIDPTVGTFLNGAEISAFDDDSDPDNDANPIAVDIDSVPDTDPTNDDVLVTDGIDPNGNDDVNSHNDVDYDEDGDGNVNEPNAGDEDDHDQELVVLPYDLALAKTISPATAFPVSPGSTVTFDITVTNQGRLVEDFSVVDYIDLSVWLPFDAALNPSGIAGALMYTWDATDPANPVVSIEGVLAPTQSVTIPVTLTIDPNYSASTSPLENWAEISEFDNDGDPSTPAPTDLDSTPNDDQADDNQPTGVGAPGDDFIDGDGQGSNPILDDEDDHDVAGVPILDLALVKTLNESTELPVLNGAEVTFDITVINQGSLHVTNPKVIDYVDLTDWEAFDVALNPAGVTAGSQALPFTWAAAGTNGEVTIAGTLAPGEAVVVPVTLQINSESTLENLSNWAEISESTATDPDGVPVTNPDGSAPVDIDSVADTDQTNDNQPQNPGDPTDDVVDNSDGDEDDHDVATVTPPTYSVGNQVWFDTDDDGMIESGEDGIDGVTVELWGDPDGDGVLDLIATTVTASVDLDGDGTIDPETEMGLYLFDGLPLGTYEIVIPGSNFDPGGPLADLESSTPTSDDPNDDIDGDDNGIVVGTDVRSGPVFIGPGMPTSESPDNDPTTPDPHENLTVDFGFNTFSLGNELWFDLNDDGVLDADEPPVVGAVVELFTDTDGDGLADDLDGDGQLTSADAIASTVTDASGEFLFDGLRPGDYIVGVPPSEFAAGGVLEDYRSSTPTTTDPNDDVSSDDNGDLDESSGYVITGAITIGSDEPEGEIDDNDPFTPDVNENLTIDLGFWQPPADNGGTGNGGVPGVTTVPGRPQPTGPTISAVTPPAPGPTADTPAPTGPLALTGGDPWPLVRIATLLIVAGAGAVFIARRRDDEAVDLP